MSVWVVGSLLSPGPTRGGVFCSCEGSPFVDKEADERANSYVGGSIMKKPVTCTPECELPNVAVPETATFTSKVSNQST